MARIRTIKPEFWRDEKLAPLDPIHRLVFLGLISQADDAGRLVDNIKSLDGMIFPETDDSSGESLEVLGRLSRILRYTAKSGQKIIQITNWKHHQKVQKPSICILPSPPKDESSGDPPGSLPTPSGDPPSPILDLGPRTMDLGPVPDPKGSGNQESFMEKMGSYWSQILPETKPPYPLFGKLRKEFGEEVPLQLAQNLALKGKVFEGDLNAYFVKACQGEFLKQQEQETADDAGLAAIRRRMLEGA